MLLEVKNLNKSFQVNDKNVTILNELSFSINSNQITSIYGASGSGKSTLFNIISGLMAADSGNIIFDGQLMDNNFDFMLYLLNKFKETLVSSHNIISDFFKIFIALKVISSRLPIGVETIYKPGLISCILDLLLNEACILKKYNKNIVL